LFKKNLAASASVLNRSSVILMSDSFNFGVITGTINY